MLLWAFAWQYTIVSSRGPFSRTHLIHPTDQPTTHPATQRGRHASLTPPSLSLSLFRACMYVARSSSSYPKFALLPPRRLYPVKWPNDYAHRRNVLVITCEYRRRKFIARTSATRYIWVFEEKSQNLLTVNSIIFELMLVALAQTPKSTG